MKKPYHTRISYKNFLLFIKHQPQYITDKIDIIKTRLRTRINNIKKIT